MTTKTINHIDKAVRIVLTVIFASLAVVCIYAIVAMQRPEHIVTATGYSLFAILPWADKDKERA